MASDQRENAIVQCVSDIQALLKERGADSEDLAEILGRLIVDEAEAYGMDAGDLVGRIEHAIEEQLGEEDSEEDDDDGDEPQEIIE